MPRRARAPALPLVLAVACGADDMPGEGATTGEPVLVKVPDFEVLYRTRHVDVAPGFTQPVCRGTLEELDRHVEAVAKVLELEVVQRPTWYWFNEMAEGGRTDVDRCEYCSNCRACARSRTAVLYSDIDVYLHELVHTLVVPAWGSSDILFHEGVAMALGRVKYSSANIEKEPQAPPSEVAGGTKHGGAHFTAWLLDRFGPQKYRELFEPRLNTSSSKEEVYAVVEDVYGIPFLELEAEYEATSALVYPALGLCDGLVEVPWAGDVWELRTTTDCDLPWVFGPSDDDAGFVVSVTLDVPDLPDEAFTLSGRFFEADSQNVGPGTLTPCYDEPIYDEGEVRDVSVAASAIVTPLQPGLYRLDLPVRDPGEVWLRIEPR